MILGVFRYLVGVFIGCLSPFYFAMIDSIQLNEVLIPFSH